MAVPNMCSIMMVIQVLPPLPHSGYGFQSGLHRGGEGPGLA